MTGPPTSGRLGDVMSALRRALAMLGCALVLSAAAAPLPAVASSHSRHAHKQVARAAVARPLAGQSYAGISPGRAHIVTATVRFPRACAPPRRRPGPPRGPPPAGWFGPPPRAGAPEQ